MSSGSRDSLRAPVVWAALVGIAVLAAVVGGFVASERFIYYWDFSGYWIATIRLGDLLHEPLEALVALVESVRHQKYNLLAAVPLAPVSRLLDHGRLGWVLTVLIVYGLPALLALGLLTVRLADARDDRRAAALAVGAVVLVPALWAPLIRGSVGIGGVGLGVAVWLLCVFPVRDASSRRLLLWGALLATLILFRRWYGFWVASWVVALGFEALVEGRTRAERLQGVRVVASVAAVTGILLLVAATPIAVKMLTTDPAAGRAAFRASHVYLDGLGKVVDRFGVLPILFAAGGLVVAWRNPETRRLARLVTVQTVTTLVVFLRVQPFDRHHYYLIAPQVAVFVGVFLIDLMRRAQASVGPGVALVACLATLVVGFTAAFVPPVGGRFEDPWSLVAKPRYRPQVRDDLGEIERLSRALDARIGGSQGKVYVLSSYWLLNEDVLKNAHLTTAAPDLSDHVLLSAHIDRKESFPRRLLKADYVVVTDPPRVHLRAEEQEVITVPARRLLAGTGIGRSFRRLPESFELQDGTVVAIFERTAPISSPARRALRERLERDL